MITIGKSYYKNIAKRDILSQLIYFVFSISLFFFANRLVDLGDENITKLKSPEELSKERDETGKEETVLGEKIDMQENTSKKKIVSHIIIPFETINKDR